MDNWDYFVYDGKQLTQKLDPGGNQPIYIGETTPGSATSAAKWRIRKFTYDPTNGVTDIKWSPLYDIFGDIWDNRASIIYS